MRQGNRTSCGSEMVCRFSPRLPEDTRDRPPDCSGGVPGGRPASPAVAMLLLVLSGALVPAGCGPTATTDSQQLSRFEQAGPIRPEVDVSRLAKADLGDQPSLIECGDVISLQMPAVTGLAAASHPNDLVFYQCRVDSTGRIRLPVIGQIDANAITLEQLENRIADAYCPRYLRYRPVVVAQYKDKKAHRVSVLGAVRHPGVYELRRSELTLVTAITEAGGVLKEGSGAILIRSQDDGTTKPMLLPVKGLNVPCEASRLKPGDTIEVKRRKLETFTITGLVRRPAALDYPPDASYSLMDAVAMGGGVDALADPKYATIYRQDSDGKLVKAVFAISNLQGEARNVAIKPGDVVSVEHSPRTHFRVIMAQLLRLGAGFNVGATYNVAGN